MSKKIVTKRYSQEIDPNDRPKKCKGPKDKSKKDEGKNIFRSKRDIGGKI